MIQALFAKAGAQMFIGGLAMAGVVLIPVSIAQHVEIHGWPFMGGGIREQAADLQDAITDPETGYLVQLDRARVSGKVCEAALGRQNQSVKAWQGAADKSAALAAAALADAKTKGGKLRQLANDILASQTVGDACKAAFARNRDSAR